MTARERSLDHAVLVLDEVCARYEAIITALMPHVDPDIRADAEAQVRATVDVLESAVRQQAP